MGFNFKLKNSAADLDICISSWLNFEWLLDHFEGTEFRLKVLQYELIYDLAVENLSMPLADTLVVDYQIALLTAAENNDFVPRNANNFQILALWHA